MNITGRRGVQVVPAVITVISNADEVHMRAAIKEERHKRRGASVGRQPRNQGFLNFFVQRALTHKNLFIYSLIDTKLQSKIHMIDPRQSFSYNTVRILI